MGVEEKERDKEKDKDRALTMSGINRFLSRREKRTSVSHEKKAGPRLISKINHADLASDVTTATTYVNRRV